MNDSSEQQGPIAVYGATGYTGRLIAAELDRAGVGFRLAGRSREKLDRLAGDLDSQVEVQAVSLDDRRGLRDLLADCSAVIACAGPFHLHGEPVMSAAVDTATHYLDTTGEQPFMRLAWEKLRPSRQRSRSGRYPRDGLRLRARRHDRRADRLGNGRTRHREARLPDEDAADPRHDALGPRDDQGRRRRVARRKASACRPVNRPGQLRLRRPSG